MPIYAYRCEACGHAQDVLQKISDPVLTVCPACGQAAFKKQVTAAGFQLKGSGWYVTDFRGGSNKAPAAGGTASSPEAGASAGDAPKGEPAPQSEPTSKGSDSGSSSSSGSPTASSTPAASPPPASST